MSGVVRTLGLSALALLVSGLAAAEPEKSAVTGTIEFKEKVAFDENTKIVVLLQDTSKADAPAVKIAEQVIEKPEKAPVPFRVEYDPKKIDPRLTYTLQVSVYMNDKDKKPQRYFLNTTAVPVLTRDKPSADVKVIVERIKKD
jgi:putative lipoprotein